MEIADILHAMMEDSLRSYGLADLAVGTVVSAKPLKVKVREDMDALPEEVLWLTEPVIEKKIPVLEHFHTTSGFRHSHALPGLGGANVMLRNTDGNDTELNLEVLFGYAVNNPQPLNDIFTNETPA